MIKATKSKESHLPY